MARPRVVDVHAHVFPRSGLDLADTGRPWFGSLIERDRSGAPVATTDGRRVVFGSAEHFQPFSSRIDRMDALGVDVQVLSLLPPLFRYDMARDVSIDAARAINDELGELAARWPTRLMALATLPMADTDAALKELDRIMGSGVFAGVEIGTHVAGRNLDDPEVEQVLQACADQSAFVFCHPANPRGGEAMRAHYLANLVGNPWETTVAIGSLIFGGVLERLPELKICFAHGGGYAPFAVGRFEHAGRVRPELRERLSSAPADTLRRCYVDTVVHDQRALAYLVDTVGIDHILLGSDFPADMGSSDPVGEVRRSAALGADDVDAILGGNITRLLDDLGRRRAAPTRVGQGG